MKYFRLIAKYIGIIVGSVLFGLAAVKLSSTSRRERKAGDKVRELSENAIDEKSESIQKRVNNLKDKQNKAKEAKNRAVAKLDKIADKSNSVKSMLDDYNRDRLQFGPDSNNV